MPKQSSNLKILRLNLLSCCIVLSSITLCSSGKTISTERQSSTILPKLEKSMVAQAEIKEMDTAARLVKQANKPETKVLISEVLIIGATGELQQKIYEIIQTKPGRTSTHSLLKKDISSIFETGYFSNVKVIPQDTSSGVRVIFEVQPNPVLKLVHVNSQILPQRIVNEVFQPQYGKTLNLVDLKKGLEKLKKWYVDKGYVLAQFIDVPKISSDGTVTLEAAEGVIEDVQVRFVRIINNRSYESQNGQIIRGQTPKLLITYDFRLKRGEVFNIDQVRKEIRRIKKTRNFNNVTTSLYSGTDPKKVVVLINVEEKDSLISVNEKLQNGRLQNLSQTVAADSGEKIVKDNQEIIRLARSKNDINLEISALYNLGNAYRKLGEYSKSIDSYSQALTLIRSQKKPLPSSNSNSQTFKGCDILTRGSENIRVCDQHQLNPQDRELLEISVLFSLGDVYRSIGEYQQSLNLNHQASSLIESIETRYKKDDSKENLVILKAIAICLKGFVYSDLGETEVAHDYVKQGQKLLTDTFEDAHKKTPNSEGEFDSMAKLGVFASVIPFIFDQDNERLTAAFLDQWLRILQNVEKPESEGSMLFQKLEGVFFEQFLSMSFYGVGQQYYQLGEKQKALELYYQVIQKLRPLSLVEIKPESEDQVSDLNEFKDTLDLLIRLTKAQTLVAIGDILTELNKHQEALDVYQQALKVSPVEVDPSVHAAAFDGIGKNYHHLGRYQEAVDNYNQALALWRTLGNQLAEANTNLGMATVERDRNRLYLAKTQIEAAIQLIEREPLPRDAASQSSIDEQSRVKYYINLASYFSAKQNFYDFYIDLLMQLHKQFPSHGYAVQAFQANEQSKNRSLLAILKRRDRYVSTRNISNSSDARSTDLASSLRLSSIQKQVVDGDSVLLAYALGEERSYLWVVSKTGISSYELPKRAEIEAAARRFYDFMTVPSLRIRTDKLAKAGRTLSEMLLGQAASQLGNKRLLIVADGVLQYIPFNALPDANSDFSEPLIVSHEIVMLPSASIFATLKNNRSHLSPTKTLAVFADPVFGDEDERVRNKLIKNSLHNNQLSSTGIYRVNSPFAEQLFPRLPNTLDEATQIASLTSSSSNIQSSGFSANRQDILQTDLEQYRLIHFATHGILDAEKPERSGLLLSAFDDKGELQRGLLSTSDMFNMQLSADLVVLSGCRTGLGKQIRGEGLIGLTGGLMYAGAERVAVSLWSVDDQATTALMSQVYKGMLRENLSPAKALRKAQLDMLKHSRWQNPYYWAAFILQGEWR